MAARGFRPDPTAAGRWRGVGFGLGVHVVRFGVIYGALLLAPVFGITGWWSGLFVNVCVVLYAGVLVTAFGLWNRIGIARFRGGWVAAAFLVYPLVESVSWAIGGLDDRDPGFAWWAASLLLVGINEELVSRGVVLERLGASFPALPAVAITAALFGMQHLSLFATTGRGAADILTNVLASACYGFALASFQRRFHWILPLILLHALSDFTTTLSRDPFGDGVIAALSAGYVALGAIILATDRSLRRVSGADPNGQSSD